MGAEVWPVLIVIATVWWLYHLWHVHRYPDRQKCKRCEGSGKIKSKDWLGRAVRGPCPACRGDAWTPRRG